jgi:hypothetical protein
MPARDILTIATIKILSVAASAPPDTAWTNLICQSRLL